MIWQVLFVLLSLLYAYWAYQLVIGIRGLRYEPPPPQATTRRRFAIVIPAHNEETVIGHLLDSVNSQSYERTLFETYVVADACTDATGSIARDHGAHVLTWSGPPMGKGRNLGWALAQIDTAAVDAIAVFDSDNVIARDWLERMNDFLEAHPNAPVVQGYLDSKNADDSWVTRVYAFQYWYLNRFWSLARSRWGLSVNLGGTGYVARTSALAAIGWDMRSLTEDLELTCKVVLSGARVWWNEAAVAFDEKPITGSASRRQRSRWLQGHYWLAVRYGTACLRELAAERKLQYFDLFLHLIAPGRSAMSYAPMFVGLIVPVLRFGFDPKWTNSRVALIWAAFVLFALIQIAIQLVVAPSLRFRRVMVSGLTALPSYLAYGLLWVPVAVQAAIGSRRQARWVRTPHVKALGIEEIFSRPRR